MRHPAAIAAALLPTLAAFLSVSTFAADAARRERSGQDVVDAVCAGCHASGKDGAPRIGDAKAWGLRAKQGLTSLTAHALTGIRKMPPHGGNAGVSDIEIERAITVMVNRSGGQWVEPMGGATPAVVRTSESVVKTQCAKCHDKGENGAPRIGDRPAWVDHLKKGLDKVVASAIHGHGPMPARGGMADLSDEEVRGATIAMFSYGLPEAPPVVPPAPADPRHKVVAGTDIYFGMMRADSLRKANPADKAIPAYKGAYHLNISLADNKSQAPVTDARVTLSVTDSMSTQTKDLHLVAANHVVSYGEFFRFDSGSAYNITAQIQRPGLPNVIEAKFEFKAP